MRLLDPDRDADAVRRVDADRDDRAVHAGREAVGGGDGLGAGDRLVLVVVDEVVVGAGQRREVRGRLLVASLGERGAAVQGKPGQADQRDEGQGEDDQDLAARSLAAMPRRSVTMDVRIIGSPRC